VATGTFDDGPAGGIDDQAWRADVEQEIGHPVSDWPSYREVWIEVCKEDEDGFAIFLAVGLDEGSTLDQMCTNVQHVCPDRLDEVEQLRSDLGDVDTACETSPEARTDEQDQLAEAMGC
jgi:hypothetical protein